ncbi:MAG TPA: PucR family transcriptional regulator ligand-binding domain-containing protein [Solirubrobacteraceae bacterium]|jgi:purine catabolism regulator
MKLTIQSLLAELGLELASGKESSGREVRWVHSTELVDPTPWLTGGELVLTTGIQLKEPRSQRELVKKLVEHRIAGLGFGTGFTHERLPSALLNAASKLDFPVFEVPYELPFIAITERAFTHLAGEQYQTLRRSMAIQERLERLVLEERGLGEVVLAAAGAIGGLVGVLDGHGETLAWHEHPAALRDSERQAIARQVREGRAENPHLPPVPFEPSLARWGERILALPVVAREHTGAHAWLIGATVQRPLGDYERLILRQTVTVVALELMHQRIERETERRLAGDVLAEALTGRLHPEELQARLRPFGLGEQTAVLAFAPPDPGAGAPLLERSLARSDVRGLVATRAGLLFAVINADSDEAMEVARSAREELGNVRAAVSRVGPTHSLRLSFHEARCALEAVRIANGSAPEVASYKDLGAFQLLLSLQDDEALASYCRSVLGPVEEGEGDYGDELLRSLDAFIEHNGHWERAASALYCHRHTLRYRIKRVEQLTGRDFSHARDRIEFWLALRGRELVR